MPTLSEGRPLRMTKRQEIDLAVARALEEDWSLTQFAEYLAISLPTARKYISERNLEPRSCLRPVRRDGRG